MVGGSGRIWLYWRDGGFTRHKYFSIPGLITLYMMDIFKSTYPDGTHEQIDKMISMSWFNF